MPTNQQPVLPALDPRLVPERTGSFYPRAFRGPADERIRQALGDALGLAQFGVNLVRLPPGAASALRHWHDQEDEFVYVLEGEATLITDAGQQVLGPGMAAGFPAGVEDGHHLINHGAGTAVYLEVGSRVPAEAVTYSDVDLKMQRKSGQRSYKHKNGQSY